MLSYTELFKHVAQCTVHSFMQKTKRQYSALMWAHISVEIRIMLYLDLKSSKTFKRARKRGIKEIISNPLLHIWGGVGLTREELTSRAPELRRVGASFTFEPQALRAGGPAPPPLSEENLVPPPRSPKDGSRMPSEGVARGAVCGRGGCPRLPGMYSGSSRLTVRGFTSDQSSLHAEMEGVQHKKWPRVLLIASWNLCLRLGLADFRCLE